MRVDPVANILGRRSARTPKELSRPQDVANGANVLLQSVLRLDQGALERVS